LYGLSALPTCIALTPLKHPKSRLLLSQTSITLQEAEVIAASTRSHPIGKQAMARRDMLANTLAVAAVLFSIPRAAMNTVIRPPAVSSSAKSYNLSNDELADIIKKDIADKQFLVTADMTLSIYDDRATFQDGSSLDGAYEIGAWVRGCNQLIEAKNSCCRLVEGSMVVDSDEAKFRFVEDLEFKFPFRPTVYLSGQVVLKRHPASGLIVSYQEYWDQDMSMIMKNCRWEV
jgi:hypothetical protein